MKVCSNTIPTLYKNYFRMGFSLALGALPYNYQKFISLQNIDLSVLYIITYPLIALKASLLDFAHAASFLVISVALIRVCKIQ
jgi:hypothetical protein